MTPEEENYEEAKRRIQEAEDNKSVELDLSMTFTPDSLSTRVGSPHLAPISLVGCSQLMRPVPSGKAHLAPIPYPQFERKPIHGTRKAYCLVHRFSYR